MPACGAGGNPGSGQRLEIGIGVPPYGKHTWPGVTHIGCMYWRLSMSIGALYD